MSKKTAMVILVGLMLFATAISAGEEKVQSKSQHADFEGTLVCMGCDLKKADGARAECSAFGHKHALKTADGMYINLLENKYSTDLVKGEAYHNKKMSVHGVYFANANQLDVESFSVDGKTKSWCTHCTAMDGCSVKKEGM